IAVFRHSSAVSARFLCQEPLFHFREKTALASSPRHFHKGLSGRESAPGAREKKSPPRATHVTRNGQLCLCKRGWTKEAREQCTLEGRIRRPSLARRRYRHRWRQPGSRSGTDFAATLVHEPSTAG